MESSLSQKSATPMVRQKPLERWLHFAYFHTASLQYFCSRRLRPAGMALGIVFVIAVFLSAGQRRDSVYQLLASALAMILLSIPWAMLRRVKVSASRELPRYATAGEPLHYTVRLHNHSRRRLQRAWLLDSAPDPRPNLSDFLHLKEPGEEERNRFDRTLIYFRWQWLLLRNRLLLGGKSQENLKIEPYATANVRLQITPLRRGVIHFEDLRILLPDPFGLFQKCTKVPCPQALLTVLPRRYPLPPLKLAGHTAFKISGEAHSNRSGGNGEFAGLRDYRPSDPLRQIHWKSWARSGKPIVKELEDDCYPRYGLIVDTFCDANSDALFESVISVAASFAATVDTHESLIDIMFVQESAYSVASGRNIQSTNPLLEILAAVNPQRTNPYQQLTQRILSHRIELSACIIVFNGWDAAREEFLNNLIRQQLICVPLIIGSGLAPTVLPGQWLDSNEIARDLLRLPATLAIATLT